MSRGIQTDLFTAVPEINEHGVMDDDFSGVETLSDIAQRGKSSWGWSIRLAQFPDGLWRSAPDYFSSTSGFSSPLCATFTGHPTRAAALEEAVHLLRYRMACEPVNTLTRRVLADMEKMESYLQAGAIPPGLGRSCTPRAAPALLGGSR